MPMAIQLLEDAEHPIGFALGPIGVGNEDLAVGLVGQPVDGIRGYEPQSAVHLVQDILLYASR